MSDAGNIGATHLTGRCLCGSVTFPIDAASNHVDACHCGMCRRWAGEPAFSIRAVGTAAIAGGEDVAVFQSSDWGARHFCSICGTNLFYAAPAYGYFGVSVGALDDLSGLVFGMEIFVDHKPDLYEFANETRKLTEADFIKMMSAHTE